MLETEPSRSEVVRARLNSFWGGLHRGQVKELTDEDWYNLKGTISTTVKRDAYLSNTTQMRLSRARIQPLGASSALQYVDLQTIPFLPHLNTNRPAVTWIKHDFPANDYHLPPPGAMGRTQGRKAADTGKGTKGQKAPIQNAWPPMLPKQQHSTGQTPTSTRVSIEELFKPFHSNPPANLKRKRGGDSPSCAPCKKQHKPAMPKCQEQDQSKPMDSDSPRRSSSYLGNLLPEEERGLPLPPPMNPRDRECEGRRKVQERHCTLQAQQSKKTCSLWHTRHQTSLQSRCSANSTA